MNHNNKNRRFPVFFVARYFVIIASILMFIGCKSKTDWRTKYNEEKTAKKSGSSKKTIDKPHNLFDYTKILDVNENTLKNKQLYSFITDWYGTPYKFGGQTSNGIDCSAFTNVLYKEIYNIQLPRSSKDIAETVNRKFTKNLKEGDLVFFAFGNSKEINHVGVYLHNNKFVHASTSKGVIISDLTEPWYGNFLVKCGAYKE